MSNDDYYDLLGVEADAPVADIRAAYRERKAEVSERDDDDAKADAAALNKAWNVLSDPYQRSRYDDQLAAGPDDDDGDDDDVVDVPTTRTRTTRTNARAGQGRGARQPLQPTITLPAGMEFAPPKRRLVAMGIDVFVLIVLFFGSFLVTNALEKSQHPTEHHLVSVLPDQINDAKKATSAAQKKASTTVDCTKKPTSDADKAYCDAKAKQDALQKQYDDATKKLAPTRSLISGVFFLVALLILLIPSLFGGQTLGKRLQGIRLVRLDGSRVGAAEVFRRYGVLALAAFAAYTFLGPVGPLVIVFVATMWTRNPNRQGLQDRFARTLVVSGPAQ
jgi:uncharacterized RDD family membrane protein YckC